MSETDNRRRYTLKKRAEGQEETRRRILEATMALHEEIGPRATTISGIAERAGVQRLTVYRHFEDETAVFEACTSHWLSLNPPPDPADWAECGGPRERRAAAVAAFFAYYAGTRRMWARAHHDVAEVPALQGPMREFTLYVDGVAAALAADLPPLARATLRHLLDFRAWELLEAQGVTPEGKLDLARAWLDGAAAA